ncbi:hypothetical protein [Rossellomorea arthrocnemi]|uniref:hypothetical protein n=1 Tax=Rossellomorea arthrocnemi TaxID=2769542 RepID=UPI001919F95A|nr:hypothetical protein [Rossellomorea arthrocnemi]
MIKFLSLVVLALSTQIIGIIMWGEYVWLYRFANGGVGGTPLEKIQPILWVIIVVEVTFFTLLGLYFKKKEE